MRILLAEHHSQVLKGLQIFLQQMTEYTVVGEATDADGLLDQAENVSPDLVLFDWELPGRPRADIIAALYALDSRPKVIVLSTKLDVAEAALKAGADLFVSKGDPPAKLLSALRETQLAFDVQAAKRVDETDGV